MKDITREPGISIKKPDKFWNKSLKIKDPRNLFSSVAKAALNGLLGNLDSATENLVEASVELGIAKTPEEIAWLLIYNSLTAAMLALVKSNQDLLFKIDNDELKVDELEIICDYHLEQFLKDNELRIGQIFFTRPKDLGILEAIKIPLRQWLEEFSVDKAAAQSISDRLPTYFVYALHEEWKKNSQKYACLTEELDTPFTQASQREHLWLRYSAWVQKQVEEPVFREAFSLKQIYVPLCAYYKRQIEGQKGGFEGRLTENKQCERVVVDLERQLETWLNKADPKDGIRVISGGPGSGKSFFAKIFAAQQAEKGNVRVLFIRLQQFNPGDDLEHAVGKFVDSDINKILPPNPLSTENIESRLLIICDGLDELAMRGTAAKEVVHKFIEEVEEQVHRFNSRETRLQVLITGRELIVQANSNQFPEPQQILHVLPYFVSENDKVKHNYKDEQELLNEDKREQWWKNYGSLKGKKYNGLPGKLDRNNLIEVTSQPLLNYLVALSFIRGEVDFSKESNLNIIYEDLLTSVYQRVWENQQHRSVKKLEKKYFVQVLEEIALSSWHGDGRKTTVQDIKNHFQPSDLESLEKEFQKEAEEVITSLLLAFYFRESGWRKNQQGKTFEFTHKSFGEYLTAKRIIREITKIYDNHKEPQKYLYKGSYEKDALRRWANLCGASAMDEYLFDFVLDEMRLQDPSDLANWQQTLCHLISFMLRHGMPMEDLNPRPDFHPANQQARNAEEALLVVLNACARVTKNISQIEWQSPEAFGTWISRLQGQRVALDVKVFSLNHLSFLDLQKCILYFRDFYSANLEGANLVEANLEGATLKRANLKGANLEGANLEGTNLEGANLKWANLKGVRNYESANFKGADLTGTVLEGKVETEMI